MKYYSLENACKKVITDLAQAYGVKSAIDIFIENDEEHLSGGFTGINVETGNIAVCINIGRSRTNMEMIHQCRHEFRHVWQLYFNKDLTEWWRDWQTEAQEKCDGRDMLAAAQYVFSAIELDAERFAFSGKDDVIKRIIGMIPLYIRIGTDPLISDADLSTALTHPSHQFSGI